ncbi:MAG: NAD(P)H-hydrate dehydratase [Methanosarcinales archaeon]|nr:NAD(P)H-hydrate dehydratase [Methanosarcinales archaeon]
MKTITSRQMDALDANCEFLGLSRLQLMENAGSAVSAEVMNLPTRERVLVVAGKGNNGGDGFVAARHLVGYDVTVILLGKINEVKTQEATKNLAILKKTGIPVIEVTDPTALEPSYFSDCDIIVDAIFGTGIKGKIREPESTAIDFINASQAKVVSVDVPSGMDPDTGQLEKAVKSNITVTFHLPKPGLLAEHSQEYVSEIAVADIGIPHEAELIVGPGDLKLVIGRSRDSHKGVGGRILIIGGGAFSGAPALAGLAALRCGADIVTIAAPKNVAKIIASFSPDLIVRPLAKKRLVREDVSVLEELIMAHDVVIIGMGLGREDETIEAVREILLLCGKVVVDADGLEALDVHLNRYGCDMVITPHAGEYKRLINEDLQLERGKLIAQVKTYSADNNVVTLLKSPEDIISDGLIARINQTGNPGMTVGGTGDVLAGITGALFAKHIGIEAASAAAYICGRAGDIAFKDFGLGLIATDVIDRIPAAMKI